MYTKVCPWCHKSYETEARNQKYCSSECCKKASTRRKDRRKSYESTKDVSRVLADAYRLARKVGDLCCIKPEGVPLEELELHHLDMNPLNNTPDNLVWLSRTDHSKLHSELPRVNMVKVLSEKKI